MSNTNGAWGGGRGYRPLVTRVRSWSGQGWHCSREHRQRHEDGVAPWASITRRCGRREKVHVLVTRAASLSQFWLCWCRPTMTSLWQKTQGWSPTRRERWPWADLLRSLLPHLLTQHTEVTQRAPNQPWMDLFTGGSFRPQLCWKCGKEGRSGTEPAESCKEASRAS